MHAALDARPSAPDPAITATALAHRVATQPAVARVLRRTKHVTSDPITTLTRKLDLGTYRAVLTDSSLVVVDSPGHRRHPLV